MAAGSSNRGGGGGAATVLPPCYNRRRQKLHPAPAKATTEMVEALHLAGLKWLILLEATHFFWNQLKFLLQSSFDFAGSNPIFCYHLLLIFLEPAQNFATNVF